MTYSEQTIPVLPFRISERRYALAVSDVVEVAAMVAVTPIPGAPDALIGMVNRQGEVLPVLDLRLILGTEAPEIDPSTLFIVVEQKKQCAGLVVDEVFQVKYITKTVTADNTGAGHYVQRVVSDDDELLQIIALESLLTQHLSNHLSGTFPGGDSYEKAT